MFKKLMICSTSILFCTQAVGEIITPQIIIKDDWNDTENIYSLGLMFPYLSDNNKVPFLDLRYSADNHDRKTTSIGAGYRYPLKNNSFFGLNGYLDAGKYRDSGSLWAGSIGAEWLSPIAQISGNVYFPISDRSLYDSKDYSALQADKLGIVTDSDYAEMTRGLDIQIAKSIFQNDDIDIQGAVSGYWRSAEEQKNHGGELKLNIRAQPFGANSYATLSPYVRLDNKDETQLGLMLAIGFGGTNNNSLSPFLLQPVQRENLNAPLLYQESTFEKANNIGKVQVLDLADTENASIENVNKKIAMLGESGVTIVAGEQSYSDSIYLPDSHSLYGNGSEINLTTESGKQATYLVKQAPAHIHVNNTDADVIQVGSNTIVSHLALSGGANAVSNHKEGTHNILLSNLDISKTAVDGVHLNQVNDVRAENLNIHDLQICEDNSKCEYSYSNPSYAPNVAFSAVGSDNIQLKDSKIDNVTYGVFVASTPQDWQNWDKISKNIQIDNLSIKNTRREALLFTGVDGAKINNLDIDNRQNTINEKPDMDLVVLQASQNISINDSTLKGGVNGLMLVNAPGIPEVAENNFKFKNIEISDTSRANIFLNPVNGVSFENVKGNNAGTVGIYMMGNDYLGHLSNIDMKNVQLNGPKYAGIEVMGPIDNISGDITINDAPIVNDKPVICRQASKWMPATLTQENDEKWQINGQVINGFEECQ